MLPKKTVQLLLIAIALVNFNQTIVCMDINLQNEKIEAETKLLKKKLELEEQRKNNDGLLHAEKIAAQKKKVEKLNADIDQMSPHHKAYDGLIMALKDGAAGTISNTGQYYFKKKIDLCFDGDLTTAELLAELNAREEYLGKQMINIKSSANAHEMCLKDPEERKTFNKKTLSRIQDIEDERDENQRLYKEYVSNKRKPKN